MPLSLPFLSKPKSTQTPETQQEMDQVKQFSRGLVTIQDIIAPEAIEVDFTYQKINSTYTRTIFVAGYPRTVPANWLSPLINYPHQINIAMYIFPQDAGEILENLKRKITEMEAEIQSDIRAGKISNINTEVKLNDARVIREQLAKGAERFFQFGLYVTVKADSKDLLDKVTKNIQSLLGSLMIVSKKATLQMDEGFKTTLPMGTDKLLVTRNMDTTSLATTFPFTSSELTMESGILYGLNEHNDSLVIFDRFKMENANMLIFAKSGAGKSYTVKLEIIRQLMFDAEVIVLDPEHEYEDLSKKVGGEYIDFTFGGKSKINPFDLSTLYEEGENELGQKIISIHGLLKVMLGEMTAQQEALLDRALIAAYKAKGITPDPATQTNEPPLMEDLYKALIGMENEAANDLSARLEKFITGSFRGIFDKASNIDITNQFTVFSVKEMEESLRPIAMYIILDFIWTKIKKDMKKRILVIDEAWYFMKHPDSASFIHSMAKRARKYYLGITTITQDVEDFLHNEWGKAIVSNASIQFLMKQSTASIPVLTETFYLSEGERQLLVAADIGEGIFFAGQNHVALRVVASPEEHEVITTDPEELLARKKQAALLKQEQNQKPMPPSPLNSVSGLGGSGKPGVTPTPSAKSQQTLSTQQTAQTEIAATQQAKKTLPGQIKQTEQSKAINKQDSSSGQKPPIAATDQTKPGSSKLPTPTPPPKMKQGKTVFDAQAGQDQTKPQTLQSKKQAGHYSIEDYKPPAEL